MNQTESAITPLLIGAAAVGAGRAVAPTMVERTFHMILTGTATVHIEVSNDPAQLVWASIGSATANAVLANFDAYKYVRANVTAYTSGTISVYMGT